MSPAPYAGPPVAVDSSGPQHILIFTAPTGGWAVQLDQTVRDLDRTRVYVTTRRPNPAFQQTQALVDHRIATTVPPETPIEVYIRSALHDQEPAALSYQRLPGR
ncbi:MAG: hypothetical protein WD749_12465 [Phycisphaerales bacterium]